MPKRNDIILEICEHLARAENMKAYKGKGADKLVRLSRQDTSTLSLRQSSAVARNMNGTIGKQVKFVADIISTVLKGREKRKLFISVNEPLKNIPITDVASGLNIILENATLKRTILDRIKECINCHTEFNIMKIE